MSGYSFNIAEIKQNKRVVYKETFSMLIDGTPANWFEFPVQPAVAGATNGPSSSLEWVVVFSAVMNCSSEYFLKMNA